MQLELGAEEGGVVRLELEEHRAARLELELDHLDRRHGRRAVAALVDEHHLGDHRRVELDHDVARLGVLALVHDLG